MPISGKDLEAYLKLRRESEPITIRGFQRLMGYNSPGKAERVLRRLERLGLAEKTPSGYIARKDLPPELSSYLIIRGLMMPRALVYAIYATATTITYTALAKPPYYTILLLATLIAPYWIEVLRQANIAEKIRRS